MPAKTHFKKWPVSGLRVLARQENEHELFVKEDVNQLAALLGQKTEALGVLQWPSFDESKQKYWGTYSSYYRSVLADTIKKFGYGERSACRTVKHTSARVEELEQEYPTNPEVTFNISEANMLERAKALSGTGLHVCGFNPMNEHSILGGAFDGAPNFEEDLARISDLGIALVQHAREDNDLHYQRGRPYYHNNLCLQTNEALITTNVQIIKNIVIPQNNFWYAKQFHDLQEEEQFRISIVGNAALCLEKRRKFTPKEAQITEEKIRTHLTAMIKGRVEVALLTDFGCGGFNNDPTQVAEIYKRLLFAEGYIRFFKGVEFTILNHNHCKIFSQVFADELQQQKSVLPQPPEPQIAVAAKPVIINPELLAKKEQSLFKKTPDKIIEGLFLGNLEHAQTTMDRLLQGKHDRAVLRCTKHPIDPEDRAEIDRLPQGCFAEVLVGDAQNNPISAHFAEAFDFIDEALKHGKTILVHCDAGVSRSPSIVIGYLIAKKEFSYQDALQLVQKQRPCIDISNFADQLLELEQNSRIQELGRYIQKREGDYREYQHYFFCIPMGYAKDKKIGAALELVRMMRSNCSKEELKQLAKDHPAVAQGDLGDIYKRCLLSQVGSYKVLADEPDQEAPDLVL